MIRKLTREDVPVLVDVCMDFHGDSVLSQFTFDKSKALYILDEIIEHEMVFAYGAFHKDQLIGGLVAEAKSHLFLDVLFAEDIGFFIKSDRRGGLNAKRLVNKFNLWCADLGVDVTQISVDAGISNERTCGFLGYMGYKDTGSLMTIGL
jgi:hypothetical protein